MNLNQFTIKSQDVIQRAFQTAQERWHQAVETGHILKALFEENEDVVTFLLKKLNANIDRVMSVADSIITTYPKVSVGEAYLSQLSSNALQKAVEVSKKAGDQFVSVEYILAGLLETGDQIAQLLKDGGVSQKDLQKAIAELRKGSKVDSQINTLN